MTNKNNFFEDISKLSGNAAGVIFESGKNLKSKIKEVVKSVLSDMDLVTREEFEVVKKMAEKARNENIALRDEIKKLHKNEQKTSKVKSKTVKKEGSKTSTKKAPGNLKTSTIKK